MNRYFLFALTISFLVSCNTEKKEEPKQPEKTVSDELIGEWRNVYMKIDMPTYNGSDSSFVLEVNENNWEEKLKIHPIRTTFSPNGTYSSKHYNLKDSVFYNPSGNWSVIGDTLIMTDTFPQKGITYKSKVKISSEGDPAKTYSEYWLYVDFDGDGQKDDHYYGKQRKQ